MNKVLYIAGYGRSGSTVLDIILGNHPEMCSVGEVVNLLDHWNAPGRRCSCEKRYSACEFWGDFLPTDGAPAYLRKAVGSIDNRRNLLPTVLGQVSTRRKEIYRTYQRRLFRYIREQSGKPIIVDSSKSGRDAAARFHALSEIAGLDVHVLHLVRNGLATMESCVVKGDNQVLEGHGNPSRFPGARATAGWALANLIASVAGSYGPSRYLRLSHESFIADPASNLHRIGSFIGVNPEALVNIIEDGEAFRVGHNVAGNRLRHQGRIRLRKTSSSGKALRWKHKAMFTLAAGWLQAYYNHS